jgi:hypothetical protein
MQLSRAPDRRVPGIAFRGRLMDGRHQNQLLVHQAAGRSRPHRHLARDAARPAGFIPNLPAPPAGSLVQELPNAGRLRSPVFAEVLSRLDQKAVVSALEAAADGGISTLLCFEAPPPDPAWCHRALVSAWLFDELGLAVPEFGHEALGYGWQHPKLHPSLMQPISSQSDARS